MSELADAIAHVPGRALLCLVTLAVALPVWMVEYRRDQKWKGDR